MSFYAGFAMQALVQAHGFQGGPEKQEGSAKLAAKIAKITAKAVENELKYD